MSKSSFIWWRLGFLALFLSLLALAAEDSSVARISQLPHGAYLYATTTAVQTTNIAGDDHVKFNSVLASRGFEITLDTSTTYTMQNNVASLGRFTLAASHTYSIEVFIPGAVFSDENSFVDFTWTRADTGLPLGRGFSYQSNLEVTPLPGDKNWGSASGTIFLYTTSVSATLVDLRFHNPTGLTQLGGTSQSVDGGALTIYPIAVITLVK